MATKYNYYNTRKVIKYGKNLYTGGAWAKFPARMPKVNKNKVLIGILALGNPTKVGAVEIRDEDDFEAFCNDYGRGWFCVGGVAYLYALPKTKANECRSHASTITFRIGELEELISR